jgi:type VI secretion system protein ImpC
MHANLSFDFQPAAGPARDSAEPFRLLVIGDFSEQRPEDQKAPLARRPVMRVDVDNLDDALQRMAPLHDGITFTALDDFHPDALFARVPVFAALRQTRQRLTNPATFAQAAAELGAAPAAAPSSGGSDLLAGLLGGKPATNLPRAGVIDALIRHVVAPHIVPDIQPQQGALVAAVDAAIAQQMRGLLHDPGFQALEAAWRGVQWLVNNLELDETLQLHVLDASREDLLADVIQANGQMQQTGVYHALVDGRGVGSGGERWSALVGLYRFGPHDADIGLLAALGLLAARAGGPLLAAADPALANVDASGLAGWPALRRSRAAPWIGLATPDVLLRLPYGKSSDPVDGFAFEEIVGPPLPQQLLWANGGLAAALLIGRAFSARGWHFEPGDEREIADLPAYTFMHEGERQLQACAEQPLDEQAAQALLSAGLMPVMSHRQRNMVTLPRMQSIADPAQPLAGLPSR